MSPAPPPHPPPGSAPPPPLWPAPHSGDKLPSCLTSMMAQPARGLRTEPGRGVGRPRKSPIPTSDKSPSCALRGQKQPAPPGLLEGAAGRRRRWSPTVCRGCAAHSQSTIPKGNRRARSHCSEVTAYRVANPASRLSLSASPGLSRRDCRLPLPDALSTWAQWMSSAPLCQDPNAQALGRGGPAHSVTPTEHRGWRPGQEQRAWVHCKCSGTSTLQNSLLGSRPNGRPAGACWVTGHFP